MPKKRVIYLYATVCVQGPRRQQGGDPPAGVDAGGVDAQHQGRAGAGPGRVPPGMLFLLFKGSMLWMLLPFDTLWCVP